MSNAEYDDWIAGLKPGDEVIIGDHHSKTVARVERLTATLVIVAGSRFRKANGRLSGASAWNFQKLIPPTPELVHKIAADKVRRKLDRIDWRKVPERTVLEIYGLVIATQQSREK